MIDAALTRVEVELERRPNPWLAALLSTVCPGLGQIYNGRWLRGVGVFFLAFLVIPYFYGILDAFWDANRQSPVPLKRKPQQLPPSLRVQLVQAAKRRGGELSVTEAVMDTGRTFAAVEKELDEMLKSGYVEIGNRPHSGVVVYRFGQLAV